MSPQHFHLIRDLVRPIQSLILSWPGAILDLVVLVSWLFRRKIRPMSRLSVRSERFIFGAFASFALLEVIGALSYLAVPVYFDHVEPLIPTIAFALLNGKPIYPPLSPLTIYGSMYGPLLFEVCAAGLKFFGATVLASKVFFVAAFITSALATFVAVKLRGISWQVAALSVSAMLIVEGAFPILSLLDEV